MTIAFDANGYLVTLIYTCANVRSGVFTTTLGFNGSAESSPNVATLAEEVRDAWLAEMEGIYDTDTNLSIVRVESQSFSTELTVGEPGTGAINSMTPQVCALLSKSSIGKGPRFRGRNYFAQVLDEGHVDEDGIISGTRLDTLNAANAAFTSAITGGAVATNLAIPQSDVEGQKSEPVLPWPEVQSQAFQPLTATQRRRIR